MNGKGSRQRPFDRNKFDKNYDEIFGRRTKQGRALDLSDLKQKIYKLISTKPMSNSELVTALSSDTESVSVALQSLKKAGSIRYSAFIRAWDIEKTK